MKLFNGIELAPMGLCFTTPVQVLFNTSKVFEGFNIKKEVTSDLLSCLAPQVGLEPTTYGLTVRRSNQLSY